MQIISCAVYLGIEGYGSDRAKARERLSFRFWDGEQEWKLAVLQTPEFVLQNLLAAGYTYRLYIKDGSLVRAQELPSERRGRIWCENKCMEVYGPWEMFCKMGIRSVPVDDGYTTPVKIRPGKRTLKNFLAAAMQPVGTVLYVYGGGWNWQDDGGGAASVGIGLSPKWLNFFEAQNGCYTYKNEKRCSQSYYPVHGYNAYSYAGLDCSGYVGWAVYNTMQAQSGKASYVIRASEMAHQYAERFGWGTFTAQEQVRQERQRQERPGQIQSRRERLREEQMERESPGEGQPGQQQQEAFAGGETPVFLHPGDIVSIKGHVWICLGMCQDGSAVILHATPSPSRCGCPGGGVQLSALGMSDDCEAYRLADDYMRTYYPKWSRRYSAVLKDFEFYLFGEGGAGGRFRWHLDERGLEDPEGLADAGAREVLEELFRPAQ